MRIWIDAEPAASAPRLFGFTTLERTLRAITKAFGAKAEVFVSGASDMPRDRRCHVLDDSGSLGDRLAAFLAQADGTVLVLDGAAVIDHRLLPLLAQGDDPACFIGDKAAASKTAILRLSPSTPLPSGELSLGDMAGQMVAAGTIRQITADQLPGFVMNLRRDVPFTLERMSSDEDRDALEKRLFQLNYKGSTDFMTKWVYPPIVWQLVRLCIRWRITPNMVTILGIVLAAVAVPLFAGGYWVAGFAAAYSMTILDSVDGKLARLTLTDSPIGNILDHGLDIVHPPFWYAAWAMGLIAGGSQAPLETAAWWLIFFYVADRLVLMVAKKRFGRGLHAVTPLDGAVRTWIARRNVNLVVLTIGLAFGFGPAAFIFISVWQGLTCLWHAARTVLLYPRARHEGFVG